MSDESKSLERSSPDQPVEKTAGDPACDSNPMTSLNQPDPSSSKKNAHGKDKPARRRSKKKASRRIDDLFADFSFEPVDPSSQSEDHLQEGAPAEAEAPSPNGKQKLKIDRDAEAERSIQQEPENTAEVPEPSAKSTSGPEIGVPIPAPTIFTNDRELEKERQNRAARSTKDTLDEEESERGLPTQTKDESESINYFYPDILGFQSTPVKKDESDPITPGGAAPVPIKENDDGYGQTILKSSQPDQPALLTYTRPLSESISEDGLLYDPKLLLEVLDEDPERKWSEDELLLVEQVTDQLSLALENAHLFEQTQKALQALEISERYQKNVAQAVAALTERGIAALPDVLQFLGEAAQASRVNYIETQVDQHGTYWRLSAEWTAEGIPSQLDNPTLRRMPTKRLAPWLKKLRHQGSVSAILTSASPQDAELLRTIGARSLLHFAVPGRYEIPGCFGFEQIDYDRVWDKDEISALQTAASALANTLAREDLFTQVEINLAETEDLYQASAELNSAVNFDEILDILRQHTILGHTFASSMALYLFDSPWSHYQIPNWMEPIASWSAEPNQDPQSERVSLLNWSNIDVLLDSNHPSIVMDTSSDARFDDTVRATYLEKWGAKSLICIPLNVSDRWFGQLIAGYRQVTGFPEQEIRRLTSLSGQAAVAVENLRLLDETRKRNQELAVLNQVISSASESLEFTEVLADILSKILSTIEFHSGLISIIDPETGKLTLSVHKYLPDKMVRDLQEKGMDGSACDLVFQTGQTIHVPNMQELPSEISSWQGAFIGPKSLGFNAYLGIPLEAKGKKLGTVCVFDRQSKRVSQESITLLQAIGQQVGVVVENVRLFQETQSALSETETLYQANAELSAADSFDDILQTLRKYTVLGQADNLLTITLFNRPWVGKDVPEWFSSIARWTSLPPELLQERYELRNYPAYELLSRNEVIISKDIPNDPRLDKNTRDLILNHFLSQSAILVPINVGGNWIGFINGMYSLPKSFEEPETRRLLSLAGQAGVSIQNIRLLDESRRRGDQLQTAAEIARDTSSTLALDTLLQRSVSFLKERFGYYHASIYLLDESQGAAIISESTGEAGKELKRIQHSIPVGESSVVGQVTLSGKPLVLNDLRLAEAARLHDTNSLLPKTNSEIGVPLKIGDLVIGALHVQSSIPNAFSEDDVAVLQTLSDQIAVAVDNARSYELAQTAVDEIREAERLKSQFLANMSHELRTPLNSIIGFSRVILKGIDGPINDLQEQDLTAIYNSGQHLLGLINDVLDLSKIEANKMDIAYEENVDLAEIVKGVISTTIGLVKGKPIELKQDLDPDLPLLYVDPMKIRQVLLNLLSNAAKYTEEGSIKIKAAQKLGKDNQPEVIISVFDSGPGIAPEDQRKLFQPFSQVDGSLTRKKGGSGLGLSICHHLVRMHGGRIGLHSIIGKGSMFYFTLPVRTKEDDLPIEEGMPSSIQPELPDVEKQIKQLQKKRTSGQLPPLDSNHIDKSQAAKAQRLPEKPPSPKEIIMDTESQISREGLPAQKTGGSKQSSTPAANESVPSFVLTIEKDPKIIDLYRRYLSDHNYSVVALTELEQSVSVASGLQPIAITLDVGITYQKEGRPDNAKPDTGEFREITGWQILRDLKSNSSTKNIPVLICSLAGEQDRAFQMGASGYLLKPILQDDLVQAIKGISNT